MSTYPAITAAIADQHRRDLIAQADAYRLSRVAPQAVPCTGSGPASAPQGRTGRPVLTARRLVTAVAAGCTAAAVFLLGPAAAAHASAHHYVSPTATAHRWAAPAERPRIAERPRAAERPRVAERPRADRLVRWAAPAPGHHFRPDVHFRGHVYSHIDRGHVF